MKHLVTLAALLTSLITLAQNPNYDPDSNGDDLIGAEDLMTFLGVYNTSLAVDTTLECEFDGTTEDEWLFGIFTGEVVIDSIVVQYSISDSTTYFEPGCPTPQVYYVDVEMEYTLTTGYSDEDTRDFIGYYNTPWGFNQYAQLSFQFNANSGAAYWVWGDNNLSHLRCCVAPYAANFDFAVNTLSHYACINSSGGARTFTLSEDGLVGDVNCNGQVTETGPWNDSEYNYFRLLPYWHYAE